MLAVDAWRTTRVCVCVCVCVCVNQLCLFIHVFAKTTQAPALAAMNLSSNTMTVTFLKVTVLDSVNLISTH